MRRTIALFAAVASGCFAFSLESAHAAVDFTKEIQPILQQSCIKCHGAEKQKGDLRLDSKTAALKGGKDGVVLVPGDAAKSDIYKRIILPATSDDVMPSVGDPLTKAQTDLIKDWINQGATWPDGMIAAGATAETTKSAPSPFAALTPLKSSSAESAAITKIGASGVEVRLIAANVNWHEANFHALGTNATDAIIAPIKDVLTLVNLNLANTKISDAGLASIAHLTNLIALHLEHTKVTDAGMPQLQKLVHLSYLNLYDTAITDAGLAKLSTLTNLQHIYLWQTKVTSNGLVQFEKTLPLLKASRGWENEGGVQKLVAANAAMTNATATTNAVPVSDKKTKKK